MNEMNTAPAAPETLATASQAAPPAETLAPAQPAAEQGKGKKKGKAAPRDRRCWATEEEARANKPATTAKFENRLYTVTAPTPEQYAAWYETHGVSSTWSPDNYTALINVALAAGFTAATAGKAAAPVTKQAVTGFLQGLSAEERAELLRQFAAGQGDQPPAEEQPKAKGRKAK
jgi:hypothetical protein